jgi:hypothetical protein
LNPASGVRPAIEDACIPAEVRAALAASRPNGRVQIVCFDLA